MAKISFRQGIVSHPKNSAGQQTFLRKNSNGKDVDILLDVSTSLEPIKIAFSHEDADYLYTEARSVNSAWTDCPIGTTYWLYWELDMATGALHRGRTTREPIYRAFDPGPAAQIVGQMWYDTTNSVFKEWQGKVWLEVVRVFAAKLTNGTTFSSVSANASNNDYSGTQVGAWLNQRMRRRAGSLVYNKGGKAIKSGKRRQFFTTEDKFLTGVPTGASLKINNNVIQGIAECPIAAYQIVQYKDYNKICLANSYEHGERLFGVVESDIEAGELTSFTTEGIIFNESWDWEAAGVAINTPVYIDNNTKTFTAVKGFDSKPVGIITGNREIYFSPRLFPNVSVVVGSGGGLTPAQLAQLNDASNTAASNASYIASHGGEYIAVEARVAANEAAIAAISSATSPDALLLTGGTMTGQITLPVSGPTSDQHAATKLYVDNLSTGFQRNFSAGEWSSATERQLIITQAEHGLPIGDYYDVIVADSATGRRVSIDYGVDVTTGAVTLYTLGTAFAGIVRLK